MCPVQCVTYVSGRSEINNLLLSNPTENANERLVQNHLLSVLSPVRERSFVLLIDRIGRNGELSRPFSIRDWVQDRVSDAIRSSRVCQIPTRDSDFEVRE
jgi:hypothetical protein